MVYILKKIINFLCVPEVRQREFEIPGGIDEWLVIYYKFQLMFRFVKNELQIFGKFCN